MRRDDAVGPLKLAARTIVLCVLSFAPLACLRLCQIRHALAQTNTAAQAALCLPGGHAPAQPDTLLQDIQRLLAALTDFVPSRAAFVLFAAVLAFPASMALAARRRIIDTHKPPPRSCFA